MRSKLIFLTWQIYHIILNNYVLGGDDLAGLVDGYEPDPLVSELKMQPLRDRYSNAWHLSVYSNPYSSPIQKNNQDINAELFSEEEYMEGTTKKRYSIIFHGLTNNDNSNSVSVLKNTKDKIVSIVKEIKPDRSVDNDYNDKDQQTGRDIGKKKDKQVKRQPNGAWEHFMKPVNVATGSTQADPGSGEIFAEADLTKKDSYEDYVTPEQDRKIYASDTEFEHDTKSVIDTDINDKTPAKSGKKTKHFDESESDFDSQPKKDKRKENKREKKNESDFDPNAPKVNKNNINKHDDYDTEKDISYNKSKRNKNIARNKPHTTTQIDSDEFDSPKKHKVKNKLSLSYYKKLDEVNDEDYDPEETTKLVENVEKAMIVEIGFDSDEELNPSKLKGTNIPKKDWFKVSTPNYFVSLPAIAQKYDFNEPIPERDREPDILKDPPKYDVKINKKI